jgi:hypothetical protein
MNSKLVAPVYTAELVLRIAKSYLWVREIGGNNRGAAIEHFLKMVGLAPGQPWCAAFVAKVGHTAFGADWPLPLVGGCATLGEAAAKKEILYKFPAPGSVFLLWSKAKNRFAHTGFVDLRPTRHGWPTVEGNTDDQDDTDGQGVYQKERYFGPNDRFVYWWAAP